MNHDLSSWLLAAQTGHGIVDLVVHVDSGSVRGVSSRYWRGREIGDCERLREGDGRDDFRV